MAQIVINVSHLDGLLPLLFEQIRDFYERKELKLKIRWVSMDQDLSIGLLIIQLIIILEVVCTFQGMLFPQIFHKNMDGSI